MLTELREIQNEVLTLLEAFWDKLEGHQGHVQFKDEFANWYTESLEPHLRRNASHAEGTRRSAQGDPYYRGFAVLRPKPTMALLA